jgi:hypothetical protein
MLNRAPLPESEVDTAAMCRSSISVPSTNGCSDQPAGETVRFPAWRLHGTAQCRQGDDRNHDHSAHVGIPTTLVTEAGAALTRQRPPRHGPSPPADGARRNHTETTSRAEAAFPGEALPRC